MRSLRDLPALDGMRGIAALLVVGFHVVVFVEGVRLDLPAQSGIWDHPAAAGFLGWGFIGVDFFFVLSAFLLSQPFLAAGPGRGLGSYAIKRLLRVAPAYYASLALTWILFGRADHWWFAMDWTEAWRHLTFLHGFWFESQLAVSAVYWTLAVELQLYLLLPLLVLAFRGRWWPLALAAAGAATLAYRAWAFVPGDIFATRFHELQLPAFLWHFALGITGARLLATLQGRAIPARWLDAGILAAIGLAIVVPSALFGLDASGTRRFLLLYRPLVAVGFAAAIVLACAGEGRVARLLASRPLRTLGDWSYSLYLTHYAGGAWLVLHAPALFGLGLGSLAFVVAVWCVLLAGVFYCVVDRPGLALKRRLEQRLRSRTSAPP